MTKHQLIIEIEVPTGYEPTGEYRKAKAGDTLTDSEGQAWVVSCDSALPYVILRKVDTWREATADDIGKRCRCRGTESDKWTGYAFGFTLLGVYENFTHRFLVQQPGYVRNPASWRYCEVLDDET